MRKKSLTRISFFFYLPLIIAKLLSCAAEIIAENILKISNICNLLWYFTKIGAFCSFGADWGVIFAAVLFHLLFYTIKRCRNLAARHP